MGSLWELIKSLVEAFLTFFRRRKEERQQDILERTAEILEGDAADRKEVDDVKDEVKQDIADSGGDPAAYQRAFDRVRKIQADK